jgi:hypothetical protein
VYCVITAPPSEAGAAKLTVTAPSPADTNTPVGAPGTDAPPPLGVTGLDSADGGPVPAAFVAVTANVYAVPFDNPETTIGLAVPDPVAPPGDATTV